MKLIFLCVLLLFNFDCFANPIAAPKKFINYEHKLQIKFNDLTKAINICLSTANYWIYWANEMYKQNNMNGFFSNLKRAGNCLLSAEKLHNKVLRLQKQLDTYRYKNGLNLQYELF